MKRWHFQASPLAIIVVAAMCVLMIALGFWQIRRGHDKQRLLQVYASLTAQPALPFDPRLAATDRVLHVQTRGIYDAQRQLLLDNQPSHDRAGYDVWTPLRLQNGTLVLVNRGWIPRALDRAPLPALPVPEGLAEVDGYWRELPRPGLRLGAPACARPAHYPAVVNYPMQQDLACVLGEPVAQGVLLLSPAAPGGYLREWDFNNGFPPSRHFGYAAQWFALTLTLLAMFIKLNLKRTDD